MRTALAALAAVGLMLSSAPARAEDDLPPWEQKKRDDAKKAEEQRKAKEAAKKAEDERKAAEHRAAVEAEQTRQAEEAAASEAARSESESRESADSDEPVWSTSEPEPEREAPRQRRSAAGPTGFLRSGGGVGLGFSAGTINGFSMKVWPAPSHGVVVGFGVPGRLNSGAAHVSYRFHPPAIDIPNSSVQVHLNLGPAVRVRFTGTTALYVDIAGGLAVGASVTFAGAPIEIFATVVPEFAAGLTPPGVGLGFDVDGLAGLRLYL